MNTRKLLAFVLILCWGITACQPVGKDRETSRPPQTALAAPSKTNTPTPVNSLTPTLTPTAEETAIPTSGPFLPPPEIKPVKVSLNPKALNPENLANEFTLLRTLGTGLIRKAIFSPSGKYLAVLTERGIFLFDGKTFEQIKLIEIERAGYAMAFNPDETQIAATHTHSELIILDIKTGRQLRSFDSGVDVASKIAFSPNNLLAVLGTQQNPEDTYMPPQRMVLWNLQNLKSIYDSILQTPPFTEALAFHPNGKELYFSANRLDLQTLQEQVAFPQEYIFDLLPDPGGKRLFGLAPENTFIKDLATQTKIPVACDGATGGAVSSINFVCVSYQEDKLQAVVRPWDAPEKEKWFDLQLPNSSQIYMALRPDGKVLAVLEPGRLQVVDIETSQILTTRPFDDYDPYGYGNLLNKGQLVLDGELKYVLLLNRQGKQTDILDMKTGAVLRSLSSPCCEMYASTILPDQKTIAARDSQGNLVFWDAQTSKIVYSSPLPKEFANVSIVSALPNGQGLLSRSFENGQHMVLNFATWKVLSYDLPLMNLAYYSTSVDVASAYHPLYGLHSFNKLGNPVGFTLPEFSAEEKGRIEFFDTITQEKTSFPYNRTINPEVVHMAVSPNGAYFGVVSTAKTIVWKKGQEAPLVSLDGQQSLHFSPDSSFFVTQDINCNITFWNITNGEKIRRLTQCGQQAFTPDGRYFITIQGGFFRLWGIH